MLAEDSLIPFHSTDLTGKRVLVLAPHPDDETIGCGGALALHTMAGDPVKVVFLTDGVKGDTSGNTVRGEYVELRRSEAVEACALLGITDIEFWPYEDRFLAGSRGALRRMIDLIESFRPELVYAPSPLEFHPDHRASCFMLCDAIGTCDPDFQVAFYEVGQPLRVNLLVDITGVLSQKEEAVNVYRSQLRERPYKDISVALNRYRSMTLPEGATHAEGFSLWEAGIIRKIGPFSLLFQQVERLAPGSGEAGPLVSVIVRTKDRPAFLAGALRSIVAQTYANLEIVVVNDGGRDVKDVVDSQAGDTPVIYIAHGKNRGRSAAANTGMNAARGLYLNFLDDDDVFYPDHVETLVRAILIKDAKVVYSGVSNAYYEGPPENPRNCVRKEVLFNRHFDPDLLLFANHIPIMSVLFHRGVFQELEGFSTELDLFEDWDFLIRASRRFSFHHVDKVTAEYRFYGVQDTEESHHRKYAYDQAQAAIFNRVLPHLTGESWIKFLESDLPHTLGRNKESLEKRIAPLVSKLEEGQKGLGEMQLESQNLMSELTRTREDLERAANTISALKAHNEKLESLLKEIFSSRGWAWLTRYRNLKSKLDF